MKMTHLYHDDNKTIGRPISLNRKDLVVL